MLSVTKIFRFEMAHALFGYQGACSNIHGHSYELHVTVQPAVPDETYFNPPGFVIDFKVLKQIVSAAVLDKMDHKLFLSQPFVNAFGAEMKMPNLVLFEAEPSAENLLLYISNCLKKALPESIQLRSLRLYETRDSYAEWFNEKAFGL